MNKKIICLTFFLAAFFASVSAQSIITKIDVINADTNSRLLLGVEDVGNSQILGKFNTTIDDSGKVSLNFPSKSNLLLAFDIEIMKEDQIVFSAEKIGRVRSGESITLDIVEEKKKQEELNKQSQESQTPAVIDDNSSEENTNGYQDLNQTENSSNEEIKNESENKKILTGFAIGDSAKNIPKKLYYIIGIILLIGIIAFFIFRRSKNKLYDFGESKPKERLNVVKLSEMKKSKEVYKEMINAERKLHEAERQLNIMKNQDKIRTIEKKLEDDRRELDKLRKGF